MIQYIVLACLAICSWSFVPVPVEIYLTGGDDSSCLTFIPAAISPNGDGINDIFEIRHSCLTAEMELEIFDLTGQLVHTSVHSKPSWNGNIGGIPAVPGNYTWKLNYRNHLGEVVKKQGQLVLVR